MLPSGSTARGGDENAESQSESNLYQLTYRGTFIDVNQDNADANSELSPRASSDPGSVSSSYSPRFVAEHAYVSNLSSWLGIRPTNSSSNVDVAEVGDCNVSSTFDERVPGACTLETCSPRNASFLEQDVARHSRKESSAVSSLDSDSGSLDVSAYNAMRTTEKMRLHRDELKVFMRMRYTEIPYERLCNALTSIQEIPEQVGEVFQQTATDLVDDVTTEVSKARQILVGKVEDPETSTEVGMQVQEIPDMVMASFQASFAKAMTNVRVHVDDVIQTLEGSNLEHEQVVQHLWAIPEEVREITQKAIKEASEASQAKVSEKLDHVMQNISEEEKTVALFQANRNIVDSLPQTLPETVRRVAEVTQCNVKHATEMVNYHGMGDGGYVANRVVADTLLQAKVGDSVPDETLTNPGSRGHPELCSRACLYFPIGKCTNGMDCAFCHAPHSKRASHLDKRHREIVRAMEYTDRLRLILPILKVKFESLDCRQSLSGAIDAISQMLGYVKALPEDKKRGKENRSLQTALKFVSARSLSALLYHAPVTSDSPHHQAIEALLNQLRPSLSSGFLTPAFHCTSELNSRLSERESDL